MLWLAVLNPDQAKRSVRGALSRRSSIPWLSTPLQLWWRMTLLRARFPPDRFPHHIHDALPRARRALESGDAWRILERWISLQPAIRVTRR